MSVLKFQDLFQDVLSCKVPVPVDVLAVHLSHVLHSFTQHPLLASSEIGHGPSCTVTWPAVIKNVVTLLSLKFWKETKQSIEIHSLTSVSTNCQHEKKRKKSKTSHIFNVKPFIDYYWIIFNLPLWWETITYKLPTLHLRGKGNGEGF